MERIENDEFHAVRTENAPEEKALAYTHEFKDLIASQEEKNPQILKRAIDIIDSLERKGAKRTEGIISVEFLNNNEDRCYYKVSINEGDATENFFVKRAESVDREGGGRRRQDGFETGFEEFLGSAKVKEKLKYLHYVEVVDYQLGYRGPKYTYFVSKWQEQLRYSLQDYINDLGKRIDKNPETSLGLELELQTLFGRFQEIKDVLGSEYSGRDVIDVNMSYNPKTRKITLFDLNLPQKND